MLSIIQSINNIQNYHKLSNYKWDQKILNKKNKIILKDFI